MGIFVQLHVGLQEERGLLHVLAAVQHGPRELHQHLLYASELIDVLYMVEALLIADMDHLVSLRNWIGVFYKYNTGYDENFSNKNLSHPKTEILRQGRQVLISHKIF